MDRVLVDVPCSGLGIIRKKPDIRYKDLTQTEKLPRLQMEILCRQAPVCEARRRASLLHLHHFAPGKPAGSSGLFGAEP